jgi:hypothetical protein
LKLEGEDGRRERERRNRPRGKRRRWHEGEEGEANARGGRDGKRKREVQPSKGFLDIAAQPSLGARASKAEVHSQSNAVSGLASNSIPWKSAARVLPWHLRAF